MLFLASGRLAQLQMLRSLEMSPFAALLQASFRRVCDVARYRAMLGVIDEARSARAVQRWWRRCMIRARNRRSASYVAPRPRTPPPPKESTPPPASPPPPPPPPSPPKWPPKGFTEEVVSLKRARLPGAPKSSLAGMSLAFVVCSITKMGAIIYRYLS